MNIFMSVVVFDIVMTVFVFIIIHYFAKDLRYLSVAVLSIFWPITFVFAFFFAFAIAGYELLEEL